MANAHSGISFNVHSYFMIVSILFSNHSMTDCHPHKIGSCYSPMGDTAIVFKATNRNYTIIFYNSQ